VIAWLRNPAFRRALLLAELVLVPAGLLLLFDLLVGALPLVRLRDALGAVGVSFTLALAGYGLFALRLSHVLAAFAIPLERASLWRIHVTSLFYYFFLPAGIGYDFSKVAKIAFRCPAAGTWRVSAAVAAERVVGGAGMYLLLLGTLPFTHLAPDSRLEWLTPPAWAWGLLATLVPVGAWLARRIARRSGRYRAGPLLSAVAVSATAHLLVAMAIWFVARSLGFPVVFPEVVVGLAATLLLQLVPVNLLGVTLGEVAAVTVYLAYGLDRPEALLLATVAYSHRLVAAMFGGALEGVAACSALRAQGVFAGRLRGMRPSRWRRAR